MNRKVAFSHKQKKDQLKQKKLKKIAKVETKLKNDENGSSMRFKKSKDPNARSFYKGEANPGRYRLDFLKENKEEIEVRKTKSQKEVICIKSEEELEVSINEIYPPDKKVLEMPKRPQWSYNWSKNQLERNELIYFNQYLDKIHKDFGKDKLSYFEHNLETWRQAWRVLERSDVVVMVTDVRHPVLHFSPALYQHVTEDLEKPLILILNKIDLVPASVVAAWTQYFKGLFPKLQVVWFTAFPNNVRKIDFGTKMKKRPMKKRIYQTYIGPKELFKCCKEIVNHEVDLTSWKEKISKDMKNLFNGLDEELNNDDDVDIVESGANDFMLDMKTRKKFENGILTVGFLGHPNVGKSSIMNGLIGKKVVSTSVTPGHTKYYQTYFLTKTVRLCDSPGLVFPSLIDKQMQILSGIYPIAQVQEPYTPVGYLAARLPIIHMLKISDHYLENKNKNNEWTSWNICEAWAVKRGFKTAKAGRPDVYRGANSILRMAVDGRLCLYMRPPGYLIKKGEWEEHEITKHLLKLKVHKREQENQIKLTSDEDTSDEDEHIVYTSNKWDVLGIIDD